MSDIQFTHLHVHSHYSILDGMSKVPDLVDFAMENGMYSIALTDHGNMYGIKELTDYCKKINSGVKGKIKEQEDIVSDETTSESDKQKAQTEIERLKKTFFKPIVGVEAYCARRTLYDKDKNVKMINPESGKEQVVDRSGYHLILLAKNKKGYQNLCKLISKSWIDGNYGRPRIDKIELEKYHEGLIVSSACLGGELPQLIIANKLDEAEKSVNWFKSIFGDDYYIELQRHKTDKLNGDQRVYERQMQVIPHLVELARKTNTKIIATNDVHFVREEHGEAHDRLICLSTGKLVDDVDRMHYTKQEWLKSPEQMAAIFSDYPESLANTMEIADKVETYSIESGPIMPMFEIPESFGTEEEYHKKFTEEDLFEEFTRNEKGEVVLSREDAESKINKLGGYNKLYRIKLEADYLAKLAWEGAELRYGKNMTDEQHERIVFELHVMKTMGFPGYFLIVQDYIRAAREELSVSVGPGRGSAAGSVVAYCLKITDVDPLKYDLLFERFLNPDRISLPDIDVDFDDDGRGEVLRWVTRKYGKEKVAHIITYGTMATKSSIADVGRVQNVPLSVVNMMKSFVPDKFDDSINPETGKPFRDSGKKVPKVNLKNCFKYVPELKEALHSDDPNVSSMLEYAEELENTIRQTGIHACGVIIGADDLTNFAPLSTVHDKETDEDVMVTQYDGHVIESVGLIKMDFLGLKTLSIIKEALKNIKRSKNEDIDIDKIPIDDLLTYELYCKGQTIGTFQFESPGMQKYLRELKPSTFEDLIAMNALYRPGPMDYIPQFIARKSGREPIVYDIPVMEKYLKDTYGVTVYQEQVMLLSRLLADFTRGESDALRKAMGKKLIAVLDKMKPKFISGGEKNGYDGKILEKIWADWEKFASYAFNKSHATCYSWVAYQTAYLKAHYPAEFMAANLTRSKDNITDVTKFMDECKNMKIPVKGPNVNESELNFTVNHEGAILFGLGGVKGVGEAAVESIIKERDLNGTFKDIFDFVERVNLSACNRKTIESLALAGAFDDLGIKREQFLAPNTRNETGSEILVRYGQKYQADKAITTNSLFGGSDTIAVARPELPVVTFAWSDLERLNKEKELVGIYLSSHPLDQFKFELKYLINTKAKDIEDAQLQNVINKQFTVGGMIVATRQGVTKKGKPYCIITLEDETGPIEFALFGDDYVKYGQYAVNDTFVAITGMVQCRPYGTQAPERKVTKIVYLSDLRSQRINSITLCVKTQDVTELFVAELTQIMKNQDADNDGTSDKVDLRFRIIDPEKNYNVLMLSRTVRVSLNSDFIKYIDNSQEISMMIN